MDRTGLGLGQELDYDGEGTKEKEESIREDQWLLTICVSDDSKICLACCDCCCRLLRKD